MKSKKIYHTVGTVTKPIEKYHTVGTVLKPNRKIPHCRNSSKTNRTIVGRCKIQDSNVNVINSHAIRLCRS
jgi:hypothetical protein